MIINGKNDFERCFERATENGLEPVIIGNTIQWKPTKVNGTCIHHFDENGNLIKTEHIGY